MNKLTHELQTPSQIDATAAMKQEINMVPRRAKYRLSGSVSQQPMMAQAKYGAPTTSPVRLSLFSMPSRYFMQGQSNNVPLKVVLLRILPLGRWLGLHY